MQAVEKISSYITQGVSNVSGPFHPFGGAVDIIVVEQEDGSFKSSPWYVRFGKFVGVLKTREMMVKISVNGVEAKFHMYLDNKGEAFFLREYDSGGEEVGLSPLSSGDETDEGGNSNGRVRNNHVESCETESISKIDVENGKIVGRTDSRRSTILGFVFGRKSPKEEDDGSEGMPRLNSLERAEIAADLLETKWSTNLPAPNLNFGKTQKVAGEETCKIDDSPKEGSCSRSFAQEDTTTAVEIQGEHFGKTKSEFLPSFRANGEVIEVYSSESGNLVNRLEIFSGIPSEVCLPQLVTELQDSTLTAEHIVDIQSSEFALLSNDTGGRSEEQGDDLTRDFIEEHRGRERSSYIFYENIQSSTVRIDVADDTTESVTPPGGSKNVELNDDEILVTSTFPFPKVEPVSTQSSTWTDLGHAEGNYETLQMHVESPVTREYSLKDSPTFAEITTGSHFDSLLQDVSEEDHAFDNDELKYSEPVCLQNMLQPDDMQAGVDDVEFEARQNVCLNVGEKSKDIFVLACSAGTSSELKAQAAEEVETCVVHHSGEITVSSDHNFQKTCNLEDAATPRSPLLSTSEDEHLIFTDADNYAADEPSSIFPIDEEVCSEEHLFLEVEENSMERELDNVNRVESPNGFQGAPVIQTTPISIPTKRKSMEESDRLVKSLPNVPSQIRHLDISESRHPLSSSAQLNSLKFDISFLKEEYTISPKFEVPNGEQVQIQPTSGDITSGNIPEQSNKSNCEMPIEKEKPSIEVSLCRHLLYEGMGVEAAAKAFESEKVDLEKFISVGPSIVKNKRLIIRIGGRYFPWNVAGPMILGLVAFDKDGIFESEGIKVEKPQATSSGPWGIWPFRFNKSRSIKSDHSSADECRENKTAPSSEEVSSSSHVISKSRRVKRREHFITPSPEQISSLNLKEGQNSVTFIFESAVMGKQQVDARIYLWKWNTKIVISDVDGTITKSDVLGQFMPLVGKDWSQTGVAHLFSSIKDNGYEFIFLSARAIAQAYLTRQFLFNLKQDGKSLPDGPVVISPDGLFPSLYREVIRRAPHEFKISCLEEIRALFPPECNPFYAGFGNRHTDEISYLKVGIPKGKIFIINPRGQVAVNHLFDTRSYTSLNSLVNGMFPPTTAVEQEEFNNWNYWRLPLPNIDG